MRIRPATPSDAHEIAEVHIASWRAAYREMLAADVLDRLDVQEGAARWSDILSGGRSETLVAEVHGRIVGFANFAPSRDPDGDSSRVGEILAMYVAPAFCSQGFGTRLCRTALHKLASAGFDEVTLWVLEQNDPAIRFYRALGFAPDGASAERFIGTAQRVVRYRRSLQVPHSGDRLVLVSGSHGQRTTDHGQ